MSEQEDRATISRAMALLGSRTSQKKKTAVRRNIRKAIRARWRGHTSEARRSAP